MIWFLRWLPCLSFERFPLEPWCAGGATGMFSSSICMVVLVTDDDLHEMCGMCGDVTSGEHVRGKQPLRPCQWPRLCLEESPQRCIELANISQVDCACCELECSLISQSGHGQHHFSTCTELIDSTEYLDI